MHTATIEMRSPEEHRERLHDLVKAARTVLVLSSAVGAGTDGTPMALVRTGDDTTMYVATLLDDAQVQALRCNPLVTAVVLCAEYALFTAEVVVSRDRVLIDSLWSDSWRRWTRGKSDPALAIVIVSPIEGSYWEGRDRHSYMYRLVPAPASLEGTGGVALDA